MLVDINDLNMLLGLYFTIAPAGFKVPGIRLIDAISPLAMYSRQMYPSLGMHWTTLLIRFVQSVSQSTYATIGTKILRRSSDIRGILSVHRRVASTAVSSDSFCGVRAPRCS